MFLSFLFVQIQTAKRSKKRDVGLDEMRQGVKMRKIHECPMGLLVPMKGRTLINLVEVALAREEIMNQMMWTTTIVRKGSLIQGKEDLVVLAIGKTEVKEEDMVVLEMKNEEVAEAVVAVGVAEEEALVEDEEEENSTDTVEVTERKCYS